MEYSMDTPAAISVDDALVLVVRLFLGCFFLPSALGKLRDMPGFVRGVLAYQILPERAARVFGWSLPWVELLLASALLAGFALSIAGGLLTLVLLSFIIAVAINLRRGRVIGCNCHGVAGTKAISWGTVARNVVLMLFALVVMLFAPNSVSFDQWLALWRADSRLVLSGTNVIIITLLLAWCGVMVQLIEWSVDIAHQVAHIKKGIQSRLEGAQG
jgi:uncharacterized membrane protein YphA (DoxX/SURF4 family)